MATHFFRQFITQILELNAFQQFILLASTSIIMELALAYSVALYILFILLFNLCVIRTKVIKLLWLREVVLSSEYGDLKSP